MLPGCWQSDVSVDSSAFVVFRSCRIKDAQKRFFNRIRALKIDEDDIDTIALGSKRDESRDFGSGQKKAEAVMLKVLQENIDSAISPIFDQHRNYTSYLMTKAIEKGGDVIPVGVLKTLRSTNYEEIKQIYWKYGQIGRSLFGKGDVAMKLVEVEHSVTRKQKKFMNKAHGMVEAKPSKGQPSDAPFSNGSEPSFPTSGATRRHYFDNGVQGLNPRSNLLPRPEEHPDALPRIPPVPVQGFASTFSQLPTVHNDANVALDSTQALSMASNSTHYRQKVQQNADITGLYQSKTSHQFGNANNFEGGSIPKIRRETRFGYENDQVARLPYSASFQRNNGMPSMRGIPSLVDHQISTYDIPSDFNPQHSFRDQMRQTSNLQSHRSGFSNQRGLDHDSFLQMNEMQNRSGMHSILSQGAGQMDAHQQRFLFNQHEGRQPQPSSVQYDQSGFGADANNRRQASHSQVYSTSNYTQPQQQVQYQSLGQRQAQYQNTQMQPMSMNSQVQRSHSLQRYGAPQHFNGNRYL